MTTLSLSGLSGPLRAIGRASSGAGKRFRGKKAAIEAIRRKRQVIDCTMMRLLEEVSNVQVRWSQIKAQGSAHEEERLTSVVARAQIMHRALMLTSADIETLSIFGLNACDADMHAATSLLARLRLEVRVSDARASEADHKMRSFMPSRRLLTA